MDPKKRKEQRRRLHNKKKKTQLQRTRSGNERELMMNNENEINNENETNFDAWRNFDGDVGVSNMLASIYGRKRQVNYPKLNTVSNSNKKIIQDQPFRTGKNQVEQNKKTRKDVNINIPKVGKKKYIRPSQVDLIRSRKKKAQIDEELKKNQDKIIHYRPPHRHAHSSNKEKEKLADIFSYKGGKGLPTELTMPVTTTAAERKEQNERIKRRQKLDEKYGRRRPQKEQKSNNNQIKSYEDQLFDQICNEIEERLLYINELNLEVGNIKMTNQIKARIQSEIQERMNQLNRLDQNKQRKMKNKWNL